MQAASYFVNSADTCIYWPMWRCGDRKQFFYLLQYALKRSITCLCSLNSFVFYTRQTPTVIDANGFALIAYILRLPAVQYSQGENRVLFADSSATETLGEAYAWTQACVTLHGKQPTRWDDRVDLQSADLTLNTRPSALLQPFVGTARANEHVYIIHIRPLRKHIVRKARQILSLVYSSRKLYVYDCLPDYLQLKLDTLLQVLYKSPTYDKSPYRRPILHSSYYVVKL